ncbi:MAG: hypothetical protein ABI681_04720 [Gemmatimonadales bacterium]
MSDKKTPVDAGVFLEEEKRTMKRVMLGLVVAFCFACFEGQVGSSTITGAYTLRTINGAPLPYTVSGSGEATTEIIDDVITLYQGGTYSEVGHSRTTVNGHVTNETSSDTGNYALGFGTSVTLRSNNLGSTTLVNIEDGSTMTMVKAGMAKVFRK